MDCNRGQGVDADQEDRCVLQVHHCKYESGRQPWEYPDEVLRTLCDECHEIRHSIEKECVDALLLLLAKSTRHELYAIVEKLRFKNHHTPMHGIAISEEQRRDMEAREEFFYQHKKMVRELAQKLTLRL